MDGDTLALLTAAALAAASTVRRGSRAKMPELHDLPAHRRQEILAQRDEQLDPPASEAVLLRHLEDVAEDLRGAKVPGTSWTVQSREFHLILSSPDYPDWWLTVSPGHDAEWRTMPALLEHTALPGADWTIRLVKTSITGTPRYPFIGDMHHDSNAMLQILSSVVQRMEQHLPRGCVLTRHPEDYMDRIQRATEQVARQFGGESFYQPDPRALP